MINGVGIETIEVSMVQHKENDGLNRVAGGKGREEVGGKTLCRWRMSPNRQTLARVGSFQNLLLAFLTALGFIFSVQVLRDALTRSTRWQAQAVQEA